MNVIGEPGEAQVRENVQAATDVIMAAYSLTPASATPS